MVNWNGNRYNEKFTYKKVLYPSMKETEEYTEFVGGDIEFSLYTDLKVSGSLKMEGSKMPDMKNLLRVYYSFYDDDNVFSGEIPLATMFISCAEPKYDGSKMSINVSCYSTLYPISQRVLGVPRTFNKGSNPIREALAIIKQYGLADEKAILKRDTGRTLSAPHTFTPDTTLLEVVNWLLNAGGANSAFPNANGLIAPFPEASEMPTYTFKDDENSIIYPQVEQSTNFYELPNTCRAIYSGEDMLLWTEAINNDPNSDISTVTLGYEKTLYMEVDELPFADLVDQAVNNLKSIASRKLLDSTAHIDYMQIKNPYCGLPINHNARVIYQGAGKDFVGNITNMKISLQSAIPTVTKIRQSSNRNYKVFVRGGWLVKENK